VIASVRGHCLTITPESAVVEVGGIGLLVICTPAALGLMRPGAEVTLATALVVREDAWTLYGFADESERGLFDLLQTVNGIGPRIAVAALGALGTAGLNRAISASDATALTKVPGVGRKGAERIVLELRDKVAPGASDTAAPASGGGWQSQVTEGLVSLGWQPRDADRAVSLVADDVAAESLDTTNVSALLRRALNRLDRA